MSTAAKPAPEYVEFGLSPVIIGATRITLNERVSGPPSKMLPALRDLAAGAIQVNPKTFTGPELKPRVTLEVDLPANQHRKAGVLHSITSRGDEKLFLQYGTHTYPIKVSDILAFRVVKVEIEATAIREVH